METGNSTLRSLRPRVTAIGMFDVCDMNGTEQGWRFVPLRVAYALLIPMIISLPIHFAVSCEASSRMVACNSALVVMIGVLSFFGKGRQRWVPFCCSGILLILHGFLVH